MSPSNNCLRSGSRVVMILPMKGYLTFAAGLLALLSTAVLLTACAEDSGWGTGYGGVQIQQDGSPSVPAGTSPPGSGAVDYVPQGQF